MSDLPNDNVTFDPLKRCSIILVSPRVPENIGAAARAMKNFSLEDLRLVEPRDWDRERAYRMARDGRDVLDRAKVFSSLREAVSDLSFLAASTARKRRERKELPLSPSEGAKRLLEASSDGRVGLVFGPEESGLSNRELDYSNFLMTIDANPEFSSLNLAQSLVIFCHSLFTERSSVLETKMEYSKNSATKMEEKASIGEIEGLFEHGREFLLKVGFLNPQNPDAVLLHFRKLLARAEAKSHEIKTLRGILRQCDWYIQSLLKR